MAKQPLYPHVSKSHKTKIEVTSTAPAIVRTARRPDGSLVSQEAHRLADLDATLRAYFNIGARSVTVKYDNLIVEWTLPERT